MNEETPLLRVCSLLNKHGAKYLVVGGRACWLHGYVRATLDVDILVPEDLENHKRIIAALSHMKHGFAAELTPQDFADNIVVKIADDVEVDVSIRAWKVTFGEAQNSALHRIINGIDVPYVDLQTLIRSKSTHREQDQVDIERLRAIQRSSGC
jgi:hypothetical protein